MESLIIKGIGLFSVSLIVFGILLSWKNEKEYENSIRELYEMFPEAFESRMGKVPKTGWNKRYWKRVKDRIRVGSWGD